MWEFFRNCYLCVAHLRGSQITREMTHGSSMHPSEEWLNGRYSHQQLLLWKHVLRRGLVPLCIIVYFTMLQEQHVDLRWLEFWMDKRATKSSKWSVGKQFARRSLDLKLLNVIFTWRAPRLGNILMILVQLEAGFRPRVAFMVNPVIVACLTECRSEIKPNKSSRSLTFLIVQKSDNSYDKRKLTESIGL